MIIDLQKYPMVEARKNTPFFADLFPTSEDKFMTVDGTPMSHGLWNMIVSHRDLKIWCTMNMKPNRGWKVTDCKKYFGLKGSGDTLLRQFEALKAEVDEIIELVRADANG